MHYRVYGLTLSSDTPLPELTTAADEAADGGARVGVQLARDHRLLASPSDWFAHWRAPEGTPWLSCGKGEDGYVLRFTGLAEFSVDRAGRRISGVAEPATPEETMRHLLLDQVLPLVVNLRGREALHATAVLTPRGVCAFAGPSGVGKSTLAASFLLAGYPVLSDDCLVVDHRRGRIVARPGYPSLRLWDDSFTALATRRDALSPVAHYTSKRRLTAGPAPPGVTGDRYPVAGVYVLSRPEPADEPAHRAYPAVEPLSCRESFMALIAAAFRFDITDRAMWVRQFHLFDRAARRVAVRRLRLPNTFAALPAVRAAILADLDGSPSPFVTGRGRADAGRRALTRVPPDHAGLRTSTW